MRVAAERDRVADMNSLRASLCALALALHAFAAPGPPSQSKISVHLLGSYSAGAGQIIQARPRVIKILGTDSGMMQAARDFKASTCLLYTSDAADERSSV